MARVWTAPVRRGWPPDADDPMVGMHLHGRPRYGMGVSNEKLHVAQLALRQHAAVAKKAHEEYMRALRKGTDEDVKRAQTSLIEAEKAMRDAIQLVVLLRYRQSFD